MNNLSEYIIEKLRIDKNINVEEAFDKRFLFVIVFDEAYKSLKKDFIDVLITCDSEPNGFILPIDYVKDNYSNWDKCEIYRIPSSYDSLEEFEDDYKNGTITPEDLEKIDEDDL